ncbi:MAG: MBL fold metallo-hydrolase [Planctomycetes bacterium]|nr:MBL fold metallo-hydrolase [Planctomycetota bacterium]
MPAESINIEVVVSPPFMENTWIVQRAGRQDCVIFDPGFTPREVIALLERRSLHPAAILLTHGHVDHIAGNAVLREEFPEIPILIGTGDAVMLTSARSNLSQMGGMPVTSPPADRLLKEGDQVDYAGLLFDVLEIPGHSPGHVVYVLRTESPCLVFGGDVLFQGSIGRSDFPGGNHRQLVTGIQQKLFALPPETMVFPGHGETTTIGEEMQTNPFCGLNS